MSSEWNIVEINSLCDGIYDGPHATPKKTNNGPVFLGISSLKNGQIDLSSLEYLSEDDFLKWTKRVVPKEGDIVFSYETRLGEAAIIPAGLRCCLGRRMALMRINRAKAIPYYVLYAYLSPAFQKVISERTIHGSTVNRIPLTEFGSFPISIPTLCVQKGIVETLKALDDRIALLRETNKTLEAIAQAIFKSWFVDFDPVRAKQEGREPEGIDAETAALFPDSFEESELGLIPKGWQWSSLGEISTVGIGKTPPRKEPQWFSENKDDVRWVSIRDMGVCGAYISQTSEYLTAESIDRFNIRLVPDNTVLLSFKMTIGRIALTDGEMTTNEAIAHFKVGDKSPLTSEFIYLHLKQFDYATLSSTSSIADAVNSKTVKGIPIIVGARSVLDVFQNRIYDILKRIKVIEQQIQTIATLRDTLLPRLISGQLRLPDAESMVEEATA